MIDLISMEKFYIITHPKVDLSLIIRQLTYLILHMIQVFNFFADYLLVELLDIPLSSILVMV